MPDQEDVAYVYIVEEGNVREAFSSKSNAIKFADWITTEGGVTPSVVELKLDFAMSIVNNKLKSYVIRMTKDGEFDTCNVEGNPLLSRTPDVGVVEINSSSGNYLYIKVVAKNMKEAMSLADSERIMQFGDAIERLGHDIEEERLEHESTGPLKDPKQKYMGVDENEDESKAVREFLEEG